MPGRIVDIHQDNRHLHLHRGFMVVSSGKEELGRVPLDELAAVIASGHGITHSSNLLAALAERGAPFVLCGNNYQPTGMLLAVEGNYQQAKRIHAQIEASKPLTKRLWQSIVKAKLTMQAAVLESLGQPDAPVNALINKVRSGDPDNIEAQAARRYWPLLFGKEFRRDREAQNTNSLLNYGYAIARSATARGVVAAGLHPSIGLHHANVYNAMRLVDDLIEPFRPLVDLRVYALLQRDIQEVNAESKAMLAKLLYVDMMQREGTTPVIQCINNLCVSLAQVFLGEAEKLLFPEKPDPMTCQIIMNA